MNAKILLVMSPQRRGQLLKILADYGFELFVAGGFQEARKKLAGPASYDLVFADAELPDGSWRDLLQFVVDSERTCEMVVSSRCGDERLWAEVIQCGVFDLIPEPYEQQEILRIIRSALDSQYMRRFSGAAHARAS